MQVPRYWRMKKHLYQLNHNQGYQIEENEEQFITPTKDTTVVQAVITSIEPKNNRAVA